MAMKQEEYRPVPVDDIYLDVIPELSMEADVTDPELPVERQNMLNHYLGQQMAPLERAHHRAPNQYVNVPQDDSDLGDTRSNNSTEPTPVALQAGDGEVNHYEELPRRQSLVQTINQERERYQSLERNVNQHQAKYKSLEKNIGLRKDGANNNQATDFSNVYNTNLMQYKSDETGTLSKPTGQGRIVQYVGAKPAVSDLALNGSDASVSVLKPAKPCMTKYIALSCVTLCCGNLLFGAFGLWLSVTASKKTSSRRRNRLNRLSLIINICGILMALMVIAALVAATVMTGKPNTSAPTVEQTGTGFDDQHFTDGSGLELGSGSGDFDLGQSGAFRISDDEDFVRGSGAFRHNARHVESAYISHNGHQHDLHSSDFMFDG